MLRNTLKTTAKRPARASLLLVLAALLTLSLLLAPATLAQELIPLQCQPSMDRTDYCALWGLVPSWEDCKCVPPEFDPNQILNLCSFTPQAASDICKSRGMYFDPVECECEPLRLLPQAQVPQIPRGWWFDIPEGVATWREGQILVHRGDGTFVTTDVADLETAIELVLQRASVEDVEAQGFPVIDADSL